MRFENYSPCKTLGHFRSTQPTYEPISYIELTLGTMYMDFIEALSTDNLTSIRAAPKTDVHSHAFLSTRLENLERWLGQPLKHPPSKMKGLEGMRVSSVLKNWTIFGACPSKAILKLLLYANRFAYSATICKRT